MIYIFFKFLYINIIHYGFLVDINVCLSLKAVNEKIYMTIEQIFYFNFHSDNMCNLYKLN